MTRGVVKRDGCRVPYDPLHIKEAVTKAGAAAGYYDESYVDAVVNRVNSLLQGEREVDITKIQAAVEDTLMQGPYKDIARAYIEYRHDRDVVREQKSGLNKEIKGLIEQNNTDLLNENANKNSKIIPTQRDLLAGIVAKHYALQHILPKDVVHAHKNGDIHYHDLDYAPLFPSFNCMLVDIENMFLNGFRMGNADIETPKSILTACTLTAQVVAQVASHTYGGTSIHRIDEVLEPYVAMSYQKHLAIGKQWCKDLETAALYARQMTEKETYDAFQALEYEINTMHTANGQAPFTTLNFGMGTSWEAKLVQTSILKVRMKGLGKNKITAVFPKLVYTLRKGVNMKCGDPCYDIKKMAIDCSAQRMYPDCISYDRIVEDMGTFSSPMGCRSFLAHYDGRGLGSAGDVAGRNNLGVVSLNLPRVALEAKGDFKRFWRILDKNLATAKKALDTRIDRLRSVKAEVAPILYCEGALGVRLNPEDSVIKLFEHGRASISLGYIGIHETCMGMFPNGKEPIDDTQKQEFGLEVVKYLRDKVEEWKKESGFGFSLYSTPSENLCDRFCRLDAKEFGVVDGVTDKGYYTNSFHLDVRKKVPFNEKFDFEAPYHPIANGGRITYAETPNLVRHLDMLEYIWDYAAERIGYFGTNAPVDFCSKCGWSGETIATENGFTCGGCGCSDPEYVSVTRRVCGYLSNPDARPFNKGKQKEVTQRVKHVGGE